MRVKFQSRSWDFRVCDSKPPIQSPYIELCFSPVVGILGFATLILTLQQRLLNCVSVPQLGFQGLRRLINRLISYFATNVSVPQLGFQGLRLSIIFIDMSFTIHVSVPQLGFQGLRQRVKSGIGIGSIRFSPVVGILGFATSVALQIQPTPYPRFQSRSWDFRVCDQGVVPIRFNNLTVSVPQLGFQGLRPLSAKRSPMA